MNVVRSHLRPAEAARLVPSPGVKPELKTAWPWLFWALWGVWLAVSDLHNDDIQGAVLRLLVGAAVLGYARPRNWILWSLALSAWVPAEPAVAAILRLGPVSDSNVGVWLLPPLVALVGGWLGRGIARGVLTHREPN